MKTFLCVNQHDDTFEVYHGEDLPSIIKEQLSNERSSFLSWCSADYETDDYSVMTEEILRSFEDINWSIFDITDKDNVERIFQNDELES